MEMEAMYWSKKKKEFGDKINQEVVLIAQATDAKAINYIKTENNL